MNARPLVDWLERHPPAGVTVCYAPPSVLVHQVLAGEIDIAMASTFPTLEHADLHLLPGLGVTATGPAWSVRLLSRVPFSEIRTLALDACSRSSTVLARIVLADSYGVTPVCLDLPPNLGDMLAHADAAVLIGDIGMIAPAGGLWELDLGAAWWQLTGLPFYFAGWVSRDAALLNATAPLLYDALEHGLVSFPTIAAEYATRLQISEARCRQYLSQVMRYHVGEAERAGLAEFRRRATQRGLLRSDAPHPTHA